MKTRFGFVSNSSTTSFIILGWQLDVERMVEMFAQAYKAGYRVSFVGC
jgi:hypothetical protein